MVIKSPFLVFMQNKLQLKAPLYKSANAVRRCWEAICSFTRAGKAPLGVVVCCLLVGSVSAQVTGGQFAFEYLRLSNAAHVSALGGISIADPDNDISFALQNPAMMRPGMHNELELTYDDYYAGIKIMNLQYGYHIAKINTSFFMGVQYLNYGSFMQTDALGNTYGDFHAVDYALTLGASRSYLDHWRYGADLKFAKSNLYDYTASAVLMDVGVNYYDTSSLWDFGVTAKNMGGMATRYNTGNPAEPLPFDLQMGVSKRFKHLPLRLIATVHHLYEWDIRYDNPADLTGTNLLGTTDSTSDKGAHFGDKLFRHVIFAAELTLAKRLALTVSYNDLQRKELALTTQPGLAGFAFGAALNLNKFQIHYARNYYYISAPYNEISLTMNLNKMFGLGPAGEKMHWNADYPDWE